MSKVFFSVGLSLDGYMAPEGMERSAIGSPAFDAAMQQWGQLMGWVENQRFFRENLKLGEGGETGQDNRILEETFQRTGVSIMGKRMFAGGEQFWPEEAPFHTPVFVLTHERREPWERPGGTTFRERQKTELFKTQYATRAGIESTIAQGTKLGDLRRSRYRGLPKTRLLHLLIAAALNFVRVAAWLAETPRAHTRQSAFGRLAPAFR